MSLEQALDNMLFEEVDHLPIGYELYMWDDFLSDDPKDQVTLGVGNRATLEQVSETIKVTFADFIKNHDRMAQDPVLHDVDKFGDTFSEPYGPIIINVLLYIGDLYVGTLMIQAREDGTCDPFVEIDTWDVYHDITKIFIGVLVGVDKPAKELVTRIVRRIKSAMTDIRTNIDKKVGNISAALAIFDKQIDKIKGHGSAEVDITEDVNSGLTYDLILNDDNIPYYQRESRKDLEVSQLQNAAREMMMPQNQDQEEEGDVLSDKDTWEIQMTAQFSLIIRYNGKRLSFNEFRVKEPIDDFVEWIKFSMAATDDLPPIFNEFGQLEDTYGFIMMNLRKENYSVENWDHLIIGLQKIEKEMLKLIGQYEMISRSRK